MARCSNRRGHRRSPSPCRCLLEAFRSYRKAEAVQSQGCRSPVCPLGALDAITIHRFIEAIGGPHSASLAAPDHVAPEIFRTFARNRSRR